MDCVEGFTDVKVLAEYVTDLLGMVTWASNWPGGECEVGEVSGQEPYQWYGGVWSKVCLRSDGSFLRRAVATLAQLVYSSSHGRSGTLTELLAKGDIDLQGRPVGG